MHHLGALAQPRLLGNLPRAQGGAPFPVSFMPPVKGVSGPALVSPALQLWGWVLSPTPEGPRVLSPQGLGLHPRRLPDPCDRTLQSQTHMTSVVTQMAAQV